MMKRTIIIALVCILAISLCVHISASDFDDNVIRINNIDVIFDDNSSLTIDEKYLIAEYMTNTNSHAQSYGLMCTLFGHKTTTEYVTTITHCVRTTSPRCLDESWELTICSRCETIIEETRIGYSYIDCCPEE